MRIDLAVDIRSDLETVFSWVADPEKAMQWQTNVAGGEILDRKPGMVGTTFRERVEEGGGGMDMEGTITAFEPPRLISFHPESRVNKVDVDYRVAPAADLVRLTWSGDIKWLFPVNLISLFAGGKMKRRIRAQSNAELAKLKELCEAPNAAAAG